MDTNKTALVLITGSSRGFGRSIALQLAKSVDKSNSLFLLTARSESGLEQTRNLLTNDRGINHCQFRCIDNETDDEEAFDSLLGIIDENVNESYDVALIVHNSGSLGAQGKTAVDPETVATFNAYYRANFFSAVSLNSRFLKKAEGRARKTFVVNVSSLLAVKPLASFSQYCSVKAARDMFFKVLAEENKGIKVLSYAPGPLNTKMVNEDILKGSKTTQEVKEMFNKMRDEGNILDPDESAAKLVKILQQGDFESGQHVDFYDK